MRSVIGCVLIACLGAGLVVGLGAGLIAGSGVATAAPGGTARSSYAAATQLVNAGKYPQALAAIDAGLAGAPQDLPLLRLKGAVLMELRDVDGAIAAFQAYIAVAKGANQREAQKIVQNLSTASVLDINLPSGSADIYLDSKSLGVLCTAAPSCRKKVMPGPHKIIVERPGYKPMAQQIKLAGAPVQLDLAPVEESSLLTVHVAPADAQPGAVVTVDDAAYTAPVAIPAGTHRVAVTLAGHVDAHLDAVAHEGKPVMLEVALTPLVPVHVEPASAELVLDGAPVAAQAGGLAVAPGAHHLVVRAPGYRDRATDIPAELPAGFSLDVALVREPPPELAPAAGRFTTRRKIALGVGGVAVVSVVIGAVLGNQSQSDDHDAFALCPSPTTPCTGALKANDLNKQGQSRATQANVAFGIAGAGAVAAAVLWVIGAPESRVAVTPRVGAVAGLDLGVRF